MPQSGILQLTTVGLPKLEEGITASIACPPSGHAMQVILRAGMDLEIRNADLVKDALSRATLDCLDRMVSGQPWRTQLASSRHKGGIAAGIPIEPCLQRLWEVAYHAWSSTINDVLWSSPSVTPCVAPVGGRLPCSDSAMSQ